MHSEGTMINGGGDHQLKEMTLFTPRDSVCKKTYKIHGLRIRPIGFFLSYFRISGYISKKERD